MASLGLLVPENLESSIAVSQHKVPCLVLFLQHPLVPLPVVEVSMVVSVAVVQVVNVVLVLGAHSLVVGLRDVALLNALNYRGLVGVDQDVVDLDCVR